MTVSKVKHTHKHSRASGVFPGYLGGGLRLGLLKLLQPHGFGGGDVVQRHGVADPVALGANLGDGLNALRQGQQRVEGKAVVLLVKRVLGYVQAAPYGTKRKKTNTRKNTRSHITYMQDPLKSIKTNCFYPR